MSLLEHPEAPKHLKRIKESLEEIQDLIPSIKCPPNPEPLGLICVATDFAIFALAVLKQTLEDSNQELKIATFEHWLMQQKSIHRAYWSLIHSGFEAGLMWILDKRGISLNNDDPRFLEYVDAVLKISDLSLDDKAKWRKFLDAFRVVRNKVSHGNSRLKPHEVVLLQENGFAAMVSTTKELATNTRHYKEIAKNLMDFYKALPNDLLSG